MVGVAGPLEDPYNLPRRVQAAQLVIVEHRPAHAGARSLVLDDVEGISLQVILMQIVLVIDHDVPRHDGNAVTARDLRKAREIGLLALSRRGGGQRGRQPPDCLKLRCHRSGAPPGQEGEQLMVDDLVHGIPKAWNERQQGLQDLNGAPLMLLLG